MIDARTHSELAAAIRATLAQDQDLLNRMRADIRPLKGLTRRIQARSGNAVSLVGTDGGNNSIAFDPFLIQPIRVVDSSDNEYCLEVITPNMSLEELDRRHLSNGNQLSKLGALMGYLGVDSLADLAPVFKLPPEKRSGSWVQVYREIIEWAVLFHLVRNVPFGTDTVLVFDGLLRSKVFDSEKQRLFIKIAQGLDEGIRRQFEKNRRRIYVVGMSKHSKALHKYRLAMALEGVMKTSYASYVQVPQDIEDKFYTWDEYSRRNSSGEGNKFVAGQLFFAKFGNHANDPVWAVDILLPQVDQAPTIFGYLLKDALDGFPVPYFPLCLQKAHENAAIVDFDLEILQSEILKGMRSMLGSERHVLEELMLQHVDPASERYS